MVNHRDKQVLKSDVYNLAEFDLHCEWGSSGVKQLAPISDAIAIVDVLSFSTCVEIAVNNEAVIFPYRFKDSSALDYARSLDAGLASFSRQSQKYCLSPTSLKDIPSGTKLVLPSPNGATLSLLTGNTLTLAGCLRNCEAVANYARAIGNRIAVIPCGEKWEDGSLRPAIEDLLGAGAILSYLPGKRSPEAEAAIAVFERFKEELTSVLKHCNSGQELIERGFPEDIELAASFNTSDCIPLLTSFPNLQSQVKGYTKVAL